MPPNAERERIENEAAAWAARLDGGGMNDRDRSALAAWLGADPRHRRILSRYRQLSAEIDERAEAREEKPAQHRSPWPRAAAFVAAAAAIVVLAAVGLTRPHELSTRIAERHVATLSDGSQVELNAQTELAWRFRQGERHVKLVRGEALFHVAKDPARPFIVETPAGFVRVTGTTFNVRATRRDDVEVTVLEGHVRVRPMARDEEKAVEPGDQALLAGEHVALRALGEEAARDAVAWRRGELILTDTPLSAVIERFAVYHQRPLIVDPSVATLCLGGRFSLDDLDGMLGNLERMLPVRVTREGSGAVRISAAPDARRR